MRLTYIYHSGFAIEGENFTIIIDYYRDSDGENDGIVHDSLLHRAGKLYVLSTHSHSDHFNPEILEWKQHRPDIQYIFSRDILEDPQYTFLLLTPSLENADESEIDKINDLYDYALTYGYNFYCVTASSDSAIAVWQDNTGADYPFYKMDETTIKTIIRGNPGVMLLHKGTIVWKQLPSHLPDEAQLNDKIENLPIGRTWIYDGSKNLGILVLIYTVPMFILLLTEKTVAAIIGKIREARRKRREKKSSLVSPEKQE